MAISGGNNGELTGVSDISSSGRLETRSWSWSWREWSSRDMFSKAGKWCGFAVWKIWRIMIPELGAGWGVG